MSRSRPILLIATLLILCGSSAVRAQVNSQNGSIANEPSRTVNTPSSDIYGGYVIGVGDILDIHVNDEDSASGRYQVDQDGKVKVSLLSAAVQAAGSTTFELAQRLGDEFKNQNILRQPSVTVLIIRGMTQNVSVLGAVMKPGTYPIEKPTTLLDLISLAGGLAPNAGSSLTISHPSDGAPKFVDASMKSAIPSSANINIPAMMSAKDPSMNPVVHSGDVITVSTAPVVFVVGSVGRPGAFSVQDRNSQMTVLQALAMAQGTAPAAALSHAIIIRKSSAEGERQEIPVDLKKVMRGKEKDQVMEANDILFVPQSGLKAGMRRMGDIGAQAAGTMVGYSLIF